MSLARSLVLTILLSALAAGLGAFGGARYVVTRMHHPVAPLDQVLHEKLDLTADQERRIATLEASHAARRKALEVEMRAANADLARSIAETHAYSPHVQQAIDRIHAAMGELQKESILHVLAMRRVLTPQQASVFDQTVSKVLTEDAS